MASSAQLKGPGTGDSTISETVATGATTSGALSDDKFLTLSPNPMLILNPVVAEGGDVSARMKDVFLSFGPACSIWVETGVEEGWGMMRGSVCTETVASEFV
jgi:hypothetical protein